MPLDAPTLLPLMHDLSDDVGLIDRSARMLTLGGGYCNNITFFCLPDTSRHFQLTPPLLLFPEFHLPSQLVVVPLHARYDSFSHDMDLP
jgi:hypothetical protein